MLTTKQKAKLCNVFSNQLATDKNQRKAQISKIIHLRGFLRALLNKLAFTIMKIAALLAKTFYYILLHIIIWDQDTNEIKRRNGRLYENS